MSRDGHCGRTNKPNLPADTAPAVRAEVAAITRLNVDAEREISRLQQKRKRLVMRENLRANRSKPEWQAKLTDGLRRAWQDPAKAPVLRAHVAKIGAMSNKQLPDLTPAQKLMYRRHRRTGATRAHATEMALA